MNSTESCRFQTKKIRVTLDLEIEADSLSWWKSKLDRFREFFTKHYLHEKDGEKILEVTVEELQTPQIPEAKSSA